jgi:eukaryotic-like serine/threonine-protein kinase
MTRIDRSKPHGVVGLEPRSSDNARARLSAALRSRYRVTAELARGGMATLYLADDLRRGRQVVIKVLGPAPDAVSAQRFRTEVRVTAALQHPNILPLLDSGEVDGVLYYVTAYVAGGSVRDRLEREGPLELHSATGIARKVATALQHVHDRGLVHRDIKPENILLVGEAPMVADFGIALERPRDPTGRLTRAGGSPGSPLYMSPEQLAGELDLNARADQYSLGCVCYEMLVGRPPFHGQSARALVTSVLTERPIPPSALRPEVPAFIERAVLRALAKDPDERFASTAAFAAALGGSAIPVPDDFAPYGSTAQVALGQ